MDPIAVVKKFGANKDMMTKTVATPISTTARYEMNSLVLRLVLAHQVADRIDHRLDHFTVTLLSGPRPVAIWRHPVPNSAHGGDIAWMCSVLFELLAQIADVHIDHVIVVIVIAPDQFQQLRPREDTSRVVRQRDE